MTEAANDTIEPDDEAEAVEIWREGFTMALYISLSQLAVMAALPVQKADDGRGLALTVALTSIGLVLAHQLAFRMSSRLVSQGSELEPMAVRLLRAQLVGGGIVTLIAVLPILIFGAGAYVVSMGLLLLFIMIVGYLVARSMPVSRPRALVYVGIVAVVALGVLVFKSLVSH